MRYLEKKPHVLVVLILAVLLPTTHACANEEVFMVDWQEVDRLVDEQKYQAAAERVGQILETARGKGSDAQVTRALVRATQLRLALHGYETGVRFLMDEPWPAEPHHRLILQLFYGQSLFSYLQAYGWEIGQREEVQGEAGRDLKTWTAPRLEKEIHTAYGKAWEHRREWGDGPLGELAAYLEEGDEPPRIRGTLRDVVSYLWVEMLADTGRWRPEDSNQLYRLDLDTLLAEAEPAAEDGPDLADPEVHPLEKIRVILADLEAWHHGQRRPEAALEARLQLLRRLQGSFSEHADDRHKLRQSLEQTLAGFDRGLPWWSMGQSLLAEMWQRESNDPEHLVKARDAARRGASVHPESAGALRCQHLVAALEQPRIQLASMAVDGPRRRSIEVTHANVDGVYFRAYRVDPLSGLGAKGRRMHPNRQEVQRLLASDEPAASWHVDLPPTPDLDSHGTFVVPPLDEPGAYVIASSLRKDFRGGGNARNAIYFKRSDLVLLSQPLPGEGAWELSVRSGATGEARPATLDVYRLDWREGHRKVDTRRTDDEGRLRLDAGEWRRHAHVVVARQDGHVALTQLYGQPQRPRSTRQSGALIYSDRSVYRPGQEVLWKVVAYRGNDPGTRFETAPGTQLTLELRDANYEVVASQDVTTNDFGSASGAFTLPSGRLLGNWTLSTPWGGPGSSIQVEEYKRPTFEVAIDEPTDALRLNHAVTLRGRADYYFGLPVSVGEARWRLSREPVYPWWYGWWRPVPQTAPRVIAHGTATLGKDGAFEVTFVPEADDRLAQTEREISYRYRLDADVTDEGGETRSGSRSVRIGFVAVDATLEATEPFATAGRGTSVTVTRRLLDGAPAAGEGRYRLVRLRQPEETPLPADLPRRDRETTPFDTEGDAQRPRWDVETDVERILRAWPDGEQVKAGEVRHGDDGEARLDFELPAGAYRLHYSTADPYGAEIERRLDLLVTGEAPLALPALLLSASPTVEPGGSARFLVHSGFPGQPMLFEVFRGEERLERRVLEAGEAPHWVEIPVTKKDRGGFGVSLTVLRDHQLMQLRESVDVPWVDKHLELAFERFRDKLTPGEKETFTVTVRGRGENGEQGAAVDPATLELVAYMFDRSLDLFAPHSPPDPLSLYARWRSVPSVSSNLGVAPPLMHLHDLPRPPRYPSFRRARLKFLDGWPIGGPGRGGVFGRVEAMPMRAMKAQPAPAMALESAAPPEMAEEGLAVTALAATVPSPPPPPEGESPPADQESLRSDFAETAFWLPHLTLGEDGVARLEFTVPDSVTEWSVWAHALTRDLRSGKIEQRTRSAKDLLIRPYLPRFLREGDRAELRLVISNAGEQALGGQASVTIEDPESGEDLATAFGLTPAQLAGLDFTVESGGTTTLTVPLAAPREPRPVSITARARAGQLADGERRPLPVLPSRLHLAQSRFAAVRGPGSRTLHFADLAKDDDSTRETESLIITLDGQLFGSVLRALPYLVDYPYQCTEQNLNRYLATGILSRLYDDHPGVAKLAARLAEERDTPLEAWDEPDPNRRLLLEETPWLRHARGGEEKEGLLKVLDPEIAEGVRSRALSEVVKAQTASGGFPWWPGGPPSPYMTLYVLQGFARALEFGLDVPKEPVVRAWAYLADYWRTELSGKVEAGDCCAEQLTFYAWLLWAYPDPDWTGGVFTEEDRRHLVELAENRWKELSPRLKGYLALALERSGRPEDARRVWESVMDSAKTDEDLGTYWAPEERSWLWYNDTVETHAFALRVLMSLDPEDPRRHGLVQWLMLDKKLGHWKSTRATAEALYGLASYLSAEGTLGTRERLSVTAGALREDYELSPEQDGRRQLVIEGERVEPSMAEIEVSAETKSLAFASATWHFATDRLPEEARGDFFHVERSFFHRVLDGDAWVLKPLAEGAAIAVGDQVEVRLSMRTKHAAEYVHLRDPRGAGFEPEETSSGWSWQTGLGHYREIRDSATNFFFEWLPVGEYTFRYRLRATTAGTFRVGPAQVQSMYAPEFVAYSAGREVEIAP